MSDVKKSLDANDLVMIVKLDHPLVLKQEHNSPLIRAMTDGEFGCLISALQHTVAKVKALREPRVMQ